MPYYNDDSIKKDGFSCTHGRFFAHPGVRGGGRVERESGADLRRMFLPRLNAEANKRLRDCSDFVRGQLMHYGIQFEDHEISGNGTLLLKKVLQAGKCDEVPGHIEEMWQKMHAEWLNNLTPKELSYSPEWVMERYFLTSGQPDTTKMATVVGIPMETSSQYTVGRMREAASKISSLHQKTSVGPLTQTIFMGWDAAAVSKAAEGHAAKESKELRDADERKKEERLQLHTNYLKTLKRKGEAENSKEYSPVGSYIVECNEIEEGYSDYAEDLTIDIRQGSAPGIFNASFSFGILEGAMIISSDENALENYCSQLEQQVYSDEDEDDAENFRKVKTGPKRKAESSRGRGRPPKKAKSGRSQRLKYFLRLKCSEMSEGQIEHEASEGTVTFNDDSFAVFKSKANLPWIGKSVLFTARKVSDTPCSSWNSWSDYSRRSYEAACVGRWH